MSVLRKIRPVAATLMTISLCLSLLCVGAFPAFAALTYYSDRTTFTTANPGLAVEDFEEGRLGIHPGSGIPGKNDLYSYLDQPLNSGTNNAVFSTGEILPGVSFAYPSNSPFILFGPGFFTTFPSKSLANAADVFGGTPMVIDFGGPGQQAVGLDFYVWNNIFTDNGLVTASTHISVYGAGDVLLGSTTVGSSASGPVFFGVLSDLAQITRLTITGDFPGFFEWEGIDNVSFKPVPLPSALLLLGTGLLRLGAAVWRRKE